MGSEAKWSDVNIFGGMSGLSWIYSYVVCMWVILQYVMLLSHCLIAIFLMCVALCHVLINFLNYSVLLLFSFFVCFTFYFVFCVFVLFLLMYIVVYFIFVYNYTDHCHRVENQLLSINIISYQMTLHTGQVLVTTSDASALKMKYILNTEFSTWFYKNNRQIDCISQHVNITTNLTSHCGRAYV